MYGMTEFCALLSAVIIKFSFSLKTKVPSRFISVENTLKVQLYFSLLILEKQWNGESQIKCLGAFPFVYGFIYLDSQRKNHSKVI